MKMIENSNYYGLKLDFALFRMKVASGQVKNIGWVILMLLECTIIFFIDIVKQIDFDDPMHVSLL